jgi:hypothetical protein
MGGMFELPLLEERDPVIAPSASGRWASIDRTTPFRGLFNVDVPSDPERKITAKRSNGAKRLKIGHS